MRVECSECVVWVRTYSCVALEAIYEDLGTPLNPRVSGAIRRHIDETGGVFPDTPAGKFPGTHAEIQAVNDLLNQGVGLGDVSVGTTRIRDAIDFPACDHCSGILGDLGITPLTDDP